MADVKVILQKDVTSLGSAGEIKQVAPGYFRNYLLPRGLAVEASKGQLRALDVKAHARAGQASRAQELTGALAQQLSAITIRIPVRVGEQGRIHGSVTNKDIAEQLLAQASITIDRHKIELREPLKSVGVHPIAIKLERGHDATVQVELVPESEAAS